MDTRILLINTRELCYFSASFFLAKIGEALEHAGASVYELDLTDGNDFSVLEHLKVEEFTAILDINSKLPRLIADDGARWLESQQALFFNYILDHPLYHHPGLNVPLRRYHAIGLDAHHCRYMKKQYPHLAGVHELSLAGTKALHPIPYSQREMEMLFAGTYLSPSQLEQECRIILQNQGADFARLLGDVCDAWQPYEQPLEDAVWQILVEKGERANHYGVDSFAKLMNLLYPVDRMRRNQIRLRVLEKIAISGAPFSVMGEGWEQSSLTKYKNVTLYKPVPMTQTIEVFGNTKILLDIEPLFLSGIHDRAASALANGCLCVSNMSRDWHEGVLADAAIFFHGEDVETALQEIANKSVINKEQMANKGYQVYEQMCTWDLHAKKLLEMIDGAH